MLRFMLSLDIKRIAAVHQQHGGLYKLVSCFVKIVYCPKHILLHLHTQASQTTIMSFIAFIYILSVLIGISVALMKFVAFAGYNLTGINVLAQGSKSCSLAMFGFELMTI